jgi:magnesium transporter
MLLSSPFTAIQRLNPTAQIFNDSVDAYASWTLFLSFVSILVLISGVVLLTHKKPEPSTTQRDGGIALNAIPGRHISRTSDGKIEGHDEMHSEDHGEEGQALWDVGDASDEEDEDTTPTPRLESGRKGSYGEEGEHLMTASPDDGDDTPTHATITGGRRHTRRRSSSSILRRNDDRDRDGADGFGAFVDA